MRALNWTLLPLSVDSVKGCGEPLLKNEDLLFRVRRQNSKQVTMKPEADTRRLGSGGPMIYVFMVLT